MLFIAPKCKLELKGTTLRHVSGVDTTIRHLRTNGVSQKLCRKGSHAMQQIAKDFLPIDPGDPCVAAKQSS